MEACHGQAVSENCTTATVSLRYLRLKWSLGILLNEGTEPKVFGYFSLLVSWHISKPRPHRSQLLQSVRRRNEVMQCKEWIMAHQEWWGWKGGRCRTWRDVPSDPQKILYPKMQSYELPMNIALVATLLGSTSLLHTSGLEERMPKGNMILLWTWEWRGKQ